MKKYHYMPLFDIRWRLDYGNGLASKFGSWTRPDTSLDSMVAFKRTEGLSRAFIEVKDKTTGKVFRPVHCAGSDFVMFKWQCIAPMAMSINSPIKEQKIVGQVIGLILVTREYEASVFVDGQKPIIKKRTETDKKFHYAGFGK
jgi:hypothetical protein